MHSDSVQSPPDTSPGSPEHKNTAGPTTSTVLYLRPALKNAFRFTPRCSCFKTKSHVMHEAQTIFKSACARPRPLVHSRSRLLTPSPSASQDTSQQHRKYPCQNPPPDFGA
ncbi:hypothetical protein SKAU_G00309510 [Synaphobranchus kaupii]|uniref:Uncharacterized protein n=1 Tax=Synaphobranchus kaupii TaxID=118154 RepID=A0A9Q1ERG4_SYNKA|nr:hypothetical protein SKAU_G00309510 [Synaphobranchus kaupii]